MSAASALPAPAVDFPTPPIAPVPPASSNSGNNGHIGGVNGLLSLAEIEKRHILLTLDRCGGNRTQAAKVLDISIRTLRNKLHEYGMPGKGDEVSAPMEDSDALEPRLSVERPADAMAEPGDTCLV